jgi:uncharacterized cofD-like protein
MKSIEHLRFKWILPGMRIKRYIVSIVIGLLILFYVLSIFYVNYAYSRTSFLRKFFFFFADLNIPYKDFVLPLFLVIVIIISILLIIYGIKRLVLSIAQCLAPEKNEKEIMNIVFEKRKENLKKKIVIIGGGTGTTSVLQGLKDKFVKVAAIITVADSGGSSGRIRREMKIPPPGDIRSCLVSLSEENSLASKLLSFRFKEKDSPLDGHNLGNIIIAGLTRITGDFGDAVIELSKLLEINGETMPFTTEDVTICAEFDDGNIVEGEAEITDYHGKIKRVFIKPDYAKPYIKALERISNADLIVIGPGSLYTSIIPPMLFSSMIDTIRRSKARKVFVVNIMTEPGETDKFSASQHIEKVIKILGKGVINFAIINTGKVSKNILEKYIASGSDFVEEDAKKVEEMGIRVIKGDFAIERGDLVRHNPEKLGETLMKLIRERA